VGVRVGVAYSRDKVALRTKFRNLSLKCFYLIISEISVSISTIFLSFWAVCGH